MQNFPQWQKIGYVILIISLMACGAYFYKIQEQSQQKKIEDNLYSIGHLKASQIADWRNECLSDAYVLMESIFLAYGLPEWMVNPRPALTRDIQYRMRSFQKHHKYDQIVFVNMKGEIVVGTDASTPGLHPDIVKSIPDALKKHRPLLFDLRGDFTSRAPHLTIIVPLFTRTKNPEAIGVFILMIDAGKYLFPLIQNWPGSTETAETLLVRRDGNDVIFLNELRHRRDTAMKLRIPLTRKEVPAVMAVLGRKGIVEGTDYRREKVISVIMPVPDSPWFIVTKMDQKEAFAAWRIRSALILASLAGLIVLILIAGLLIRQRHEKEFYRSNYVTERKNSTILHSIGDAVIAADASGLVEMLNPTAERLTGWTQKEARGKPLQTVFHLIHEDNRSLINDLASKILNSGQTVEMTNHTLLVAQDGTERPIDDSAAPVFDEEGKVSGIVLVFHDCTLERRAQKELLDANERLELAQTAARLGVWDWDQNTNTSQWSSQIFRLLGLDRKKHEPSLKTWLLAVHPDDKDSALTALKNAIKNQTILNSEYRVIHPDGKIRWLYSTGKAIDEDGKARRMLGICLDITERKKAEEHFLLSMKKWQSTFDSILDPIALLDENGIIQQSNQAFADLAGKDVADVIGHDCIQEICGAGKNTEDGPFARSRKTLRREVAEIQIFSGTYLVTVDPIIDRHQRFIGAVHILQDITERKQMEKALKDSEQNFRNLFENAPVGIFRTNARGKALAINKAMAHILSFESTQDALNYYQDLGTQLYTRQERRGDFLKLISQEGRVQNFEYEARTVDGRNIWLSMNARMVKGLSDEDFIIEGFATDITHRRQMQEALRESEEKYRTLFDASPQGILLAELESRRFVYGNPAICNMLGYSVNELEQLTVADIHPADSLTSVAEQFQSMSYGKIDMVHEVPCQRKDGSLFYANISGIVITIGGRRCNLGFFTDITEHRQSIEKLKESEQRYRLIFEGSPNGILIVDSETQKHIYANPAICLMLGYSQAELREMLFADIYIPEIRRQALEDFQRQAMGQKTMVYNIPCVRKDKTILFADIGGTRTILDGQVCNVGFFTDVTERKKAEEKLHEAFQTSDDIIRIIPSGLLIYQYSEPDRLHLIAGNPAAQRLMGLDTEKMKGWEFNEIFPKAAAEGLTDLFLNVIRTGQTFESEDFPYEDGHISGSYHIRAFSLPGDRLAIAFENITERKKAQQEKAKLEAQLAHAQKMESVGRLAGGVAHDFNNMLSIILGHAEMALTKIDPGDSLHADLTSINTAARRSADLTRQLLAFARKQTIAPKVLDLNDTVMGMLKMLQRLIGEEIDLVWVPGANLSPVMIDPGQLDQMLANLCINARDAIVSTGKIIIETKNIHFSPEFCKKHSDYIPGQYVLLAVSDNGCGMDHVTIGHLFEPFFTTKDVGRGTGLGLATVYGIVKQNAGFISVYSEPGVGSTFKIYLPRYEGKDLEKQGEPEAAKLEKGQGLILLVEDELTILQMGKQMLERMGYNVLMANSPGEAQKIASTYAGAIDLLITDVIMPEMNGRDLARLLAESNPAMKQLFMSGYTADAIAHHGVLDEGIKFIQKPFSISELSAKIKEVMSN